MRAVRRWVAGWSLARRLSVLLAVLVLLVVGGGSALAYVDARDRTEHEADARVVDIAVAVARAPAVVAALTSDLPVAQASAEVQPYAEAVRRETGVDFVVVMRPDRTRLSHPDRSLIGRPFLGTVAPALRGATLTETYTGTLGPSLRSVVPVRDADDQIVGLVSVGITVSAIGDTLTRSIGGVLLLGATILVVGTVGAVLLGRWLRRRTHDLGPAELTRMYEYYDAVLHSVREGLLLLDRQGRVVLVNDEARSLLGLSDDAVGRPVADAVPGPLGADLATGEVRRDELHLTADRVVVVNQNVAEWSGRSMGTVVTLRDHTELRGLTNELDAVRGLAEALRSQAHESANRLHAVVSLIELGETEQAVAFATGELGAAQRLTDDVVAAVDEPVLAALLLGKSAEAAERGVELVVVGSARIADTQGIPARDLVTVVGNLVDNAVDAALAAAPPRRVTVTLEDGDGLAVTVADSGAGLTAEQAAHVFERGWSTKTGGVTGGRGLGLALVDQVVRRYGGTVGVTSGGTDGGAVFTARLPAGERVS